MNITLKQLEYFQEVAQTLSFSRAAENLYMSQSALSRSILALEDELGVILFLRNKHGVAMTPAGAILASRVPHLRSELEKTFELVTQIKEGMRGRLALGIERGIVTPELILSAITYCQASVPFVQLDPQSIEAADLLNNLKTGRLDFLVMNYVEPETLWNGAASLDLCENTVMLAVSDRCPLDDFPPVSFLKKLEYAFPGDKADAAARQWVTYARSAGFNPSVTYFKDTDTFISRIEMGLNVAVLPENHQAFGSAHIKGVKLENPYTVTAKLVWQSSSLNPVVPVFARLIEADL